MFLSPLPGKFRIILRLTVVVAPSSATAETYVNSVPMQITHRHPIKYARRWGLLADFVGGYGYL